MHSKKIFQYLLLFIAIIIMPRFLTAQSIKLDVPLANPYMQVDQNQQTYLQVALSGKSIVSQKKRASLNLALVIDKSGSMSGLRMNSAKQALLLALDRLDEQDIVSIIVYDSRAQVLSPAGKLTNRDALKELVNGIQSSGSTALYDGVMLGASEVQKNFSEEKVNRIILLSDGMANIGPRNPAEFAKVGQELIQKNITVTTIGLGDGYNEDLMSQLASNSDGNHAFARYPQDLEKIFQHELGDILNVVAQNVEVQVEIAPQFAPRRSLGREVKINGQTVKGQFQNIFANQKKYLLLEMDIPKQNKNGNVKIGTVTISYLDMFTKEKRTETKDIVAHFTDSKKMIEAKRNKSVEEAATLQIAEQKNREALALRDAGQVDRAKTMLSENAKFLQQRGAALNSPTLEKYSQQNKMDAEKVDSDEWRVHRKKMRKEQSAIRSQQVW